MEQTLLQNSIYKIKYKSLLSPVPNKRHSNIKRNRKRTKRKSDE